MSTTTDALLIYGLIPDFGGDEPWDDDDDDAYNYLSDHLPSWLTVELIGHINCGEAVIVIRSFTASRGYPVQFVSTDTLPYDPIRWTNALIEIGAKVQPPRWILASYSDH